MINIIPLSSAKTVAKLHVVRNIPQDYIRIFNYLSAFKSLRLMKFAYLMLKRSRECPKSEMFPK